MIDWLIFLILMGLYLGFANGRFVSSLRKFVDKKEHGTLLALMLLLPFILLTLPDARNGTLNWLTDVGIMLLYILVPTVATLWRPATAKSLHLLDVIAILAIWFPIEFDWLPQAEAQLGDGFGFPVATLTGILVAMVCFLVLRPLSQIGYTFRITKADLIIAGKAIGAYFIIGLPLGLVTRFLLLDVAPFELSTWVLAWPLGFLFTALPEELLFRGIIQNQIHDRIKSEWLALGIAALIFGLAHVNNGTPGYPVPNWMYVIMATLAGVAYGWTWRKTGKITVAAVVHATVNYVWGILLGG